MSKLIVPQEQGFNPSNQQLIISTFGLQSLKTVAYKAGMPNSVDKDQAKGGASKMLGAPVFSDLNISAGSYVDNNGKTISYNQIKIDTVLFDVRQSKNLVFTPIQGSNTTVKEYISDQDYQINIIGVLSAPNGQFPFQDMADLIKVLKAPIPLSINSWYLQLFNIYNIVITDYDMNMRAGYYSQQAFSISCVSDEPVELKISK